MNEPIFVNVPDSANCSLPDPALRLHYENLEDRTIWLDEDVTQERTIEITKQIIRWNQEDNCRERRLFSSKKRKPITLCVFTNGGDLDAAMSLISCIESSKTPVIGINCGIAYSAGAFILLACHERWALSRSTLLIHQGAGRFGGTFDQVCAQVAAYQEQINDLVDFVKERTSYPEEEVEKNIAGEWYISAEDALKNGAIDKIINSLGDI